MLASLWLLGVGFPVLGMICLGLFYQQGGWFAHDILHNSVFRSRKVGYFVGSYLLTNWLLGGSGPWWRWRHNAHHAKTNSMTRNKQPIDEDKDLTPFLVCSPEDWKIAKLSKFGNFLVQFQWIYIWLLYMAVRPMWFVNGMLYSFRQQQYVLVITACLHYPLLWGIASSISSSIWAVAVYFTGGQLLGGFFISIATNP